MDVLLDILLDAGKDTLSLVPFLFATYMVLEALEHAAGERVNGLVRRAGAAGPVVGALLGVLPQCGFSAMAATLYAGRVVTLGTLVAVFLSTSDEMLPILVAEQVEPAVLARILGLKVLLALATGVVIDVVLRGLRHNGRVHAALRRSVFGVPNADGTDEVRRDVVDQMAEAGEGAGHIHRLCEQAHCGCHGHHSTDGDAGAHLGGHGHVHGGEPGRVDEHGHGGEHGDGCDHAHDHAGRGGGAPIASIARSALSHTVQVSAFIFLVTLALVAVLETVGEEALASFLAANEGLAVVASTLVGLIPNCSASVVITQLYLEGVLGFAPMMSGLLVSAGVGYLVLFRTNRHPRENAAVVLLLAVCSMVWGFALSAFGA